VRCLLALAKGDTSRLESLADLRILDTAPEQVFDDLARLAALICDTPIAVIDFVDEQRVWFKAKIGIEVGEIPREQSFSAYTILHSDALILPDPLEDERFANNLLVTKGGIRFYAGIPLILAQDHAVGTLAAMDRIPHLLTAEQLDSLTILARRIVHELELRQTSAARSPQQKVHLVPRARHAASIRLVEDKDNLRIQTWWSRTVHSRRGNHFTNSSTWNSIGNSASHVSLDITCKHFLMAAAARRSRWKLMRTRWKDALKRILPISNGLFDRNSLLPPQTSFPIYFLGVVHCSQYAQECRVRPNAPPPIAKFCRACRPCCFLAYCW
jgi:GAF domain-containing protein